MRITHTTDPDTGVCSLVVEFQHGDDPDRVADLAWQGVNTVLEQDRRKRGAHGPMVRLVAP